MLSMETMLSLEEAIDNLSNNLGVSKKSASIIIGRQLTSLSSLLKGYQLKEKVSSENNEYQFTSFLDEPDLPLGLRNNNPGNLRKSKDLWRGKLADPKNLGKGFERFKSIEYGIRANAIDIIGDIAKDGNDTIEKLINTYAPENENNTKAYIKFVCNQLGLSFNETIKVTEENICKLLDAIYYVELGANHAVKITSEMIAKGVSMINSGARQYLDA